MSYVSGRIVNSNALLLALQAIWAHPPECDLTPYPLDCVPCHSVCALMIVCLRACASAGVDGLGVCMRVCSLISYGKVYSNFRAYPGYGHDI